MERGSDKHASRLDDELERETRSIEQGAPVEARAQEGRQAEAAGDDESHPDARLSSPGGDVDRDALEERSELAMFLQPAAFPGRKGDLLASAREQHAPGGIIARLERLPDDREYENVQAVWEDISDAATDAY